MTSLVIYLLFVGVAYPLVQGFGYDEDFLVPPSCPPCEAKSCPELKYCAGTVLKDNCGCCSRCSSKLFQAPAASEEPAPVQQKEKEAPEQEVNPCEKRQCPKFKVCMVNQQGLPICRCPSIFVCTAKTRSRTNHGNDQLCGTDGVTYESRCHLRVASCQNSRRIKRKHEGPCTENDLPPNPLAKSGKEENNDVGVFASTTDETELLQRVENAKRRKIKRRKKNRNMSRSERKAMKERKRLERKNRLRQKRRRRMKRRNKNGSYSVYSDQYGYLLGKHTNWSKSQVRKSKI